MVSVRSASPGRTKNASVTVTGTMLNTDQHPFKVQKVKISLKRVPNKDKPMGQQRDAGNDQPLTDELFQMLGKRGG